MKSWVPPADHSKIFAHLCRKQKGRKENIYSEEFSLSVSASLNTTLSVKHVKDLVMGTGDY